MATKKTSEPKIIRPDDIDPHYNAGIGRCRRPGHTQVDFEERVNFRRLHDYRLARTRAALANSGLGALLCFDQHNIRYTTSTVIGEWARDKLTRYSLLTGNGDPYIWDFGSAAKHHRLHAPWLHHDHCRAGLLGLRGASAATSRCFATRRARSSRSSTPKGVGNMPLGLDVVEPPMLFELQKLGIEVRDGQQTLLQAREVKNIDELTLLNMAAAMVDGVYQDIAEALKPGVKESEIVALATGRLYGMGSDCVEAINSISGERCSPHPHNFTDRLIRPGDQAFFDIIQSFMGYRTCYYRTFNVGRATSSQRTAYRKAREWMDRTIDLLKPGVSLGQDRTLAAEGEGHRLRQRDGCVRAQLLPRPRTRTARAAADLAAELAEGADRAQGWHGVRSRDLLSGERRHLGGTHRGGGHPHAVGTEDHLAVSGGRIADRQSVLGQCISVNRVKEWKCVKERSRLDRHRPHGLRNGGAACQGRRATLPSGIARARRPSRLTAYGAKVAASLPELAACDIVFCMVSTWDDVKEVVAGPSGLLSGAGKRRG